ncbi:DNA-directed RNA polymerase sigma-70 factor [Asanoa ishikariensis]|uniref:RNA polymerase sigma-70 factor, ECF subfamily n=1 Tax=Asanoa ishikariensis TaxID=137265 RepID=A0A1H3M9K8_9ACTN|nr:sigma-70 family RNA polymerase sigma factor [Asanoa ishikariensis]GIF65999.1 DNA-directed RNA polymerase sigma-70 factor [Asanoa ishikariensis]SDY73361.1 RNA polymerase sigma-70 factor, ECF subfamily [Asanoa ishikariensis]
MPATDIDLVLAAQSGDVSSLGSLLTRHRPGQLAVAYGILGAGPDAEDAVQEAALVALRRIGDLRDPSAVGPWLRMIVRNACKMRLRGPVSAALDERLAETLPSAEPDPAELLEQHAARDWVWHALDELSPSLRLVVMLRYFTGVTSYQDIADACGVPVGTVRSRLSEARRKLGEALLATADTAHDDVTARTAARRRTAEEAFAGADRGQFAAVLAEDWSPTVESFWPPGIRATGHDFLVRGMDHDLADGVAHRLTNVVASRDLDIWEFDLVSPPDDPAHCPPGAVWVQHREGGLVQRARLFHLPRPVG